MKKILILANDVTTIVQFRKELIKALVDAGNKVLVSVPDHPRNAEIEELGATIVESKASRHGKNPLQDIALLLNYRKILPHESSNIEESNSNNKNYLGDSKK